MNGGHDFGESGRAAPVRGRAAVDRFQVHQRHQGARGARVAQNDLLALGVFDRGGELGGPAGVGASLDFKFSGASGGAATGLTADLSSDITKAYWRAGERENGARGGS